MLKRCKILTATILFSSYAYAGGFISDEMEDSIVYYIDDNHASLSNSLEEWSCIIDDELSSWLCKDPSEHTKESKKEKLKDQLTGPVVKEKVHYVDAFFQNRKYLDDTDDAFLSLRFDSLVQSRDPNHFKVKVGVQLPLSKTKKEFKVFVGGINPNNKHELVRTEEDKTDPELGVNYFAPETYGIESKYSLGIRGIDPFVRARFYTVFTPKNWRIEPSQILKYSLDEKFEEETNIYFDRYFPDLSLFRMSLHRKTQDEINGMDYAFSFQYYWSPANNIGIRVTQAFIGNTEFPYLANEHTPNETLKTFGGIYQYATSLSFRQNIWRKWFFYEVRPGVNFYRGRDYKPNYSVRVFFDIHFGKFTTGR